MTPIHADERTFLSVAAGTALRQLARYGVPGGELDSLRPRIESLVESGASRVREAVGEEAAILRGIPEEPGEDRNTAEFVMLITSYADMGFRIAERVFRSRVAESN